MTWFFSIKSKKVLPREAFAVVGVLEDPDTWKLPHHTKAISKALAGKLSIESTVDWNQVNVAGSPIPDVLAALI